MPPRIRGRRVALLLACALPLMAVDDMPEVENVQVDDGAAVAADTSPSSSSEDKNNNSRTGVMQQSPSTNDTIDRLPVATAAHETAGETMSTSVGDESVGSRHNLEDVDFILAAQRLLEDKTLTTLPNLLPEPLEDWTTMSNSNALYPYDQFDDFARRWGHNAHNVVVPFRPDYVFQSHELVPELPSSPLWSKQSVRKGHGANTSKSSSTERQGEGQSNETSSSNEEEAEMPSNQTVAIDRGEEERRVDAANIKATTMPDAATGNETTEKVPMMETTDRDVVVDYASKSAGALILENSPGWQGTSNLLHGNKDQYAIIPCAETNKFFVIGLSEDIRVKQLVLANYERYSSHVKEFDLLGSQTMGKWVLLGSFTAKRGNGKQVFELEEPSWVRYLKIRIGDEHYGDEHFLTVSQVMVHGNTMLQGFHENWEEATDGAQNSEAESSAGEDTSSAEVELQTEEDLGESHAHEGRVPHLFDFSRGLSFEEMLKLVTSINTSNLDGVSVLPLVSPPRISQFALRAAYHRQRNSPEKMISSVFDMEVGTAGGEIENRSVIARKEEGMNVGSLDLSISLITEQLQPLVQACLETEVKLRNIGELERLEKDNGVVEAEETIPVQHTIEGGINSSSGEKSSESSLDTAPTKDTKETTREDAKSAYAKSTTSQSTTAKVRETNIVLARILERFPSASCLEKLDFSQFRSMFLHEPDATGGPQGGGMEPIFKKLTDEIKALQSLLSVHDQFATDSAACYQRVILQLLVDQEAARSRHEERINKLEHEMHSELNWLLAISGVLAQGTLSATSLVTSLFSFLARLSLLEMTILGHWLGAACAVLTAASLFVLALRQVLRKTRGRLGLHPM